MTFWWSLRVQEGNIPHSYDPQGPRLPQPSGGVMHGSLLLSGSESERRALKEDRGRENESERIFSNGLLGTAASASDADFERASERVAATSIKMTV